ncbi:MAG: hypothetical protein K2Q10_11545, partial [Rhodospirillales bacterium]|nr:hypothetical protein [Rhodospirillales bacterium]
EARGATLRLWNAGGEEALPITLRRWNFTPPTPETLSPGLSDTAMDGVTARAFTLPGGPKRLSLTLPPMTAASLSGRESTRTLWSGGESAAYTLDSDAERLLLLHAATDQARATLDLLPLAEAPPVLVAGRILKRTLPEAGTLRLEVTASRTQHLRLAGIPAQALLWRQDGRAFAGTGAPVEAGAVLEIRHGPGALAVWLEDRDGLSWPALSDAGPAPERLPALLPLSGPAMVLNFAEQPPGLLEVTVPQPALSALRRGDGPASLTAWQSGARLRLFHAGGPLLVGVQPLHDGNLAGNARLGRSEPLALGEGLGPKVRLAPGEARLFSFDLEHEQPI